MPSSESTGALGAAFARDGPSSRVSTIGSLKDFGQDFGSLKNKMAIFSARRLSGTGQLRFFNPFLTPVSDLYPPLRRCSSQVSRVFFAYFAKVRPSSSRRSSSSHSWVRRSDELLP